MPDVQDFDSIVAHSIEYLVGIPNDKQNPYLGIIRPISAMGLIAQLRDSLMDARRDISSSAFGTLIQVFNDPFPIGERFRGVPNPHSPWRLSASATTSSETNSPRSA